MRRAMRYDDRRDDIAGVTVMMRAAARGDAEARGD